MDDLLLWLLDTVQAVDPLTRTVLAGVAIMLETSVLIGLIVPGDTVVIIASMGVSSFLEAVAMIIAVVVGALIGESIGYALGRWLGPRIRVSWVGRRIGEENWARAERYLHRRGGIAIFLSRFLPVLHSLVPLTVGMSRFSYRRFLLWTTPACILWAVLYVSITSLAAGGFRQLSEQINFAGYFFVAIIVLFLVLMYVAKRVIGRREKRHLDAAQPNTDASAPTDVQD